MSVARLCHFAWWMLTRNASKQSEVDSLRKKLWQPPVGFTGPIDKRSPWSPENEAAAFAALQSQLGLKSSGKAKKVPLRPKAG